MIEPSPEPADAGRLDVVYDPLRCRYVLLIDGKPVEQYFQTKQYFQAGTLVSNSSMIQRPVALVSSMSQTSEKPSAKRVAYTVRMAQQDSTGRQTGWRAQDYNDDDEMVGIVRFTDLTEAEKAAEDARIERLKSNVAAVPKPGLFDPAPAARRTALERQTENPPAARHARVNGFLRRIA
jgi:hypothetical protein